MNKYILEIDGMKCGMCEMHVEEEVRKHLKVKKVKASHLSNILIVITEANLSVDDFHNILDPTGYRIVSFVREVAKKTILGWR